MPLLLYGENIKKIRKATSNLSFATHRKKYIYLPGGGVCKKNNKRKKEKNPTALEGTEATQRKVERNKRKRYYQ